MSIDFVCCGGFQPEHRKTDISEATARVLVRTYGPRCSERFTNGCPLVCSTGVSKKLFASRVPNFMELPSALYERPTASSLMKKKVVRGRLGNPWLVACLTQSILLC